MEICTVLYEYSAITESGSILDCAEENNIILIMMSQADTVADSADAIKAVADIIVEKKPTIIQTTPIQSPTIVRTFLRRKN
jgi:hypothetical protein